MFKHLRMSVAVLALLALTAGLAPTAEAQWGRRRVRAPRAAGSALVARAQQITGDRFQFQATTNAGVRVYSVSRPNRASLNAIDRGLTQLFAAARRRGYRARLSHANYTVFIARPDRTRNADGAYSPDIALGAAQYRGSVYDQGGYVYAAGMVLSNEPAAFIVAEHERDFNRIADVARYEGEHLVLYHNDRRLYSQTADHSRGGSHPILQ
jgi:hypothetical protein